MMLAIGWICVALADFIAVLALKDCWFSGDPKATLSVVLGLFIVTPFTVAGLWILGVNISWHITWTLVPAFVMIFEGARRF